MLERAVITSAHFKIVYDTGYLYLKVNTSRTVLGQNLITAGLPRMPPGAQAHHWLPLAQKEFKLEREFMIRGIGPNLAVHGEFMDLEKHKLNHGKGTTGWPGGDVLVHQWDRFFLEFDTATAAQVFVFRDQLKALCSGAVTNADQISWPYPK